MSRPSSTPLGSTQREWAVAYARVHTRLLTTTLTKATKADTDKHRRDLAASALDEARGIVAALERAAQS